MIKAKYHLLRLKQCLKHNIPAEKPLKEQTKPNQEAGKFTSAPTNSTK